MHKQVWKLQGLVTQYRESYRESCNRQPFVISCATARTLSTRTRADGERRGGIATASFRSSNNNKARPDGFSMHHMIVRAVHEQGQARIRYVYDCTLRIVFRNFVLFRTATSVVLVGSRSQDAAQFMGECAYVSIAQCNG